MKAKILLVSMLTISAMVGTTKSFLDEELNPDNFLDIEESFLIPHDFHHDYIDIRRNETIYGRDNQLAKTLLEDRRRNGDTTIITLLQSANVYTQMGLNDQAIHLYHLILSKTENMPIRNAALLGLAYAYRNRNQFERSIVVYRHLIHNLAPQESLTMLAQRGLLWALLCNEQWGAAHELYRSTRTLEQNGLYDLIIETKGRLTGFIIFIQPDSGLAGDTFTFGPLAVKSLQKMGADVIWQVSPALYPLLSRQEWGPAIRLTTTKPDRIDYTVAVDLMDLMPMLDWHVDTIPADFPYIKPRADVVEYWKKMLASDTKKIKIGVSFAAGNSHDNQMRVENAHRVFSLRLFLESLRPFLNEVSIYSLQLHDDEGQIASLPDDLNTHLKILPSYNSAERDRYEDVLALVTDVLDYIFVPGSVPDALSGMAVAVPSKAALIVPEVRDYRLGKLDRTNTIFFPHIHQIQKADMAVSVPRIVKELLEAKK